MWRTTAAVVLALGLAACGTGGARDTVAVGSSGDPSRLGACPAGIEPGGDVIPWTDELRQPGSWVELAGEPRDRGDATEGDRSKAVGDERARRVEIAVRRVLHGGPPQPQVVVSDQALGGIRSEIARGARVLTNADPVTGRLRVVASLRQDGSVAFLGTCQHGDYGVPFAAYARNARKQGKRGTDAELLVQLVEGGAGEEEQAILALPETPKPTWEQLPPTHRHLDLEADPPVPQDVLDGLESTILKYQFPADWRDFPASICTRTSIGWNECAGFATSPVGEETATFNFHVPAEGLEIWLVGPLGDTDTPIALLQQLSPDEVAAEDPYLVGDPTIVTLEAMVERARDGERRIFCYTSESVKNVACV